MPIVSWIFFGAIIVLAIIGAIKGLTRGFARQLVRTLTIIGSVALSVWVATLLYNGLIGPFFANKTSAEIAETVLSFLDGLGISLGISLEWLSNFDAEVLQSLFTLPVTLILVPIIFSLVFVIVSGISILIHALISGLLGFRKSRNNGLTRVLGLVLGAVQGVAVALVIMLPLVGLTQTFTDTLAILNEQEEEDDEVLANLNNLYNKNFKPIQNSIITKAGKAIALDAIYDSLVIVDIQDEKFDSRETVPSIASLYVEFGKLEGADFKDLTEEQQEAVRKAVDKIGDDDFLSTVISGALRGLSKCYGDVVLVEVEDAALQNLLDKAVLVFTTSDRKNIDDDLHTITEVYFVLCNDGVLDAFAEEGTDSMMEVFTTRNPETGTTAINDIIGVIKENPRTAPLVDMVAEFSVSLMAETLDLGEDGKKLYQDVSEDLDKTLQIQKDDYANEDEYIAAVSDSISQALTENSIDLPQEVIDEMAKKVSEDDLAAKNASAAELIITYADAIAAYENGELE